MLSSLKGVTRHIAVFSSGLMALGFLCVLVVYFWFSAHLPKLDTLSDYRPPTGTKVYSADNQLIAEFYKERRYVVNIEDMPDLLIKAYIASEDSAFFSHSGINVMRIIAATLKNLKAGHYAQGASTITQQVARTMLLSSEKKISRKVKEILLASRMEKRFSKNQILYLYLNQIFLGHNAYGVEAAARTYFRKSVKELTLPEAAVIAGLPQAPSRYDPIRNPEQAKRRQAYVLTRMMDEGFITEQQASEAYMTPLKVFPVENLSRSRAPHYAEWVRRYLAHTYGEDKAYSEGYSVYTACLATNQKVAQEGVRNGLRELDHRQGYRGPLEHLDNVKEWPKVFLQTKKFALRAAVPYRIIKGRPLRHTEKTEIQQEASPQEEPPATAQVAVDDTELPVSDDEVKDLEKEWYDQIPNDKKALYKKVGKTPLEPDVHYKAVVIKVEAKKATVRVGDITGTLGIEDARWARKPNPEVYWEYTPLINLNEAIKRGDVILVSIKSLSEKGVQFALAQEPLVEGAILSMDIPTGFVEAMVGGYDFNRSEFNRALQAMRQPGSTIKPLIYASGIDRGLTPATIVVDSPITFRDEDAEFVKVWKPGNFGEKFYGDTTYRDALVNSRNIPTIKIVQALTVPYVIQYIRHLGITTPINQDLSISLGSSSVYLYEMIQVYSMFANAGRRVRPIFIKRIVDRNGQELLNTSALGGDPSLDLLVHAGPASQTAPQTTPTDTQKDKYAFFQSSDPEQRMSPQTAYMINDLLRGVVEEGTATPVKALGVPAAGKTGTTSDYIDAWFMGFTKHTLTGTWTGFDEVRTLGALEVGGRAALPIWMHYMKYAVQGKPVEDFQAPDGIETATIDSSTGAIATGKSQKKFTASFKTGTLPGQEKAVAYLPSPDDAVAATANATANNTGAANKSPSGAETEKPAAAPSGDDFFRKELDM
jgi:penicillin-binding protein 1A